MKEAGGTSIAAGDAEGKSGFRHADGEELDMETSNLLASSSSDEASTSGRLSKCFLSVPRAVWSSGMACMAVASFLQSAGSLCVKLSDGRIPVFQIVAVRSGICMIVTIGMIKIGRISPVFGHRENYIALFFRGFMGATSMAVYYFAIMLLPLADVMTIFFTHPALVLALAWLCRGEAVGWTGLLGMFLSLLGVFMVAQPPFLTGGTNWSSEHIKGVTNSLLAALTAAVAFVAIRYISKRESSLSIALSFHTMGVMTSVVPLAIGIGGHAVAPGWVDWLYLLNIAVCSFTSHAFIARAFQVESAAKSAAGGYTQVVFGYIYGILIFHDAHNVLGILGSFVICGGVVAVSWPQKKPDPPPEDLSKSDLEDSAILEMAPLVEHAGPTSKDWEAPRQEIEKEAA